MGVKRLGLKPDLSIRNPLYEKVLFVHVTNSWEFTLILLLYRYLILPSASFVSLLKRRACSNKKIWRSFPFLLSCFGSNTENASWNNKTSVLALHSTKNKANLAELLTKPAREPYCRIRPARLTNHSACNEGYVDTVTRIRCPVDKFQN